MAATDGATEPPLFTLLASRLESMTRNHRALARYIRTNYQGVAFSNIKQLAALSGISEATIVRFAKSLGFDGYPALQKEIRRLVRADLKGTERFELSAQARAQRNGQLSRTIGKELENIAHLDKAFDAGAFRAAVERLSTAPEVVVAGARSTATLACHFWFGLTKIGIRAQRVLAVTSETYDCLNGLDRRACVVVMSYPRYLRDLVRLAEHAKHRGLATIAVTDSPFSPLRGDITLHTPAESASFVAFHCAPLILLNTLLHDLSLVNRKRTLQALQRFEAVAESEDYFHHG